MELKLQDLMREILDNACPSEERIDGSKVFYIETHCKACWVTARRVGQEWEILQWYFEDC